MDNQYGFLSKEKKFLQPLCLLIIYIICVFSVATILSPINEIPPAWTFLPFSIIFAVLSVLTIFSTERKRFSMPIKLRNGASLFIIWIALVYFIFPKQDLSFNTLPPAFYHAVGSIILSVISWRILKTMIVQMQLINLIPRKKIEMQEKFHDWAHNFLQGHSVVKNSNLIKRKTFFIFLVSLISIIIIFYQKSYLPIPFFITGIISLFCMLLLFTNLYKYELYTRWITQGINIRTFFFKRWLRLSFFLVFIIITFSVFLPNSYTILSPKNTANFIKSIFVKLNKSTSPDYDRLNREDRERRLKQKKEDIKKTSRRQLDLLEKKQPPLLRIFNIAFIILLILFLAALMGGFIKRMYRYKKIPALFTIPVLLWELLVKFFNIYTFLARIFFFMFPGLKKRGRKNAGSQTRKDMEQFFSQIYNKVSPEKRVEIENIIRLYITFVEECASRGIRYSRGLTPGEFKTVVLQRISSIEKPLHGLTDIFYECRYSEQLIGDEQFEKAKEYYNSCRTQIDKLELAE